MKAMFQVWSLLQSSKKDKCLNLGMLQDFDGKLKRFRENSQDFERLANETDQKMADLESSITSSAESTDSVKDKSDLGQVQESVGNILMSTLAHKETLARMAEIMDQVKPVAKDEVTRLLQTTLADLTLRYVSMNTYSIEVLNMHYIFIRQHRF